MQPNPDLESSESLDGPDDDARAARAELVAWLRSKGISDEEIDGATSPMLLASRRLIGDDGTYVSTRDIAEKTGMDIGLVQRVQRAVGLPAVDDVDAAVYLRSDGEAVAHTGRFIDLGFDADQLLRVTRTLAEGLSNAAETMRSAALANVLQPGASERDIARGSEHIVAAVAPLLGPMVEDMLLLQLRHSMETEAVNASERAAGAPLLGAREVAVAFADLVGFTRLGEETPPEDLEKLANRLGDMARDVAEPPVRFIKTIGDAVMLVCPDPPLLLRAMLRLVGAAGADEDFPQLRVGIAFGAAVCRAGDWFGSPVNIASRVTGAARSGAVLVTESVRESIGEVDGIDWSFAGAKRLKGIKGDTKFYRARRTNASA